MSEQNSNPIAPEAPKPQPQPTEKVKRYTYRDENGDLISIAVTKTDLKIDGWDV